MNHEITNDRIREIQDAQAIDASFSEQRESDLVDTPAVMAAFNADEEFHKNLRRQAAKPSAKARQLAVILATLEGLE